MRFKTAAEHHNSTHSKALELMYAAHPDFYSAHKHQPTAS